MIPVAPPRWTKTLVFQPPPRWRPPINLGNPSHRPFDETAAIVIAGIEELLAKSIKISKLQNLWIQTNEIWNWFDINVNIIIDIRVYILYIIIYYVIYRTRTGDIITAPWYLSGDLLTRQACNVRKISRSFDTFLEAGSKTNSLFPFFITYDTKCAKAINSYSILFKLLHLTTWN